MRGVRFPRLPVICVTIRRNHGRLFFVIADTHVFESPVLGSCKINHALKTVDGLRTGLFEQCGLQPLGSFIVLYDNHFAR